MTLRHALLALVALSPAAPLGAQDDVEFFWSDRWNAIYHRFTDVAGDGEFDEPGDVAFHVDPASPTTNRASALRTTVEGGKHVAYWLWETDDVIVRGVDENGDGDAADPGESVLLLNATGHNPTLPQNPDFADGTLRTLVADPYNANFDDMASNMEDGQRAFYFATSSGADTVNVDGEGINFLIFRGVDGNGDRDVNDAGEVTLYFDGSNTGPVDLQLLRGVDVLDGVVYAVGLAPFPALFPGPDGNVWIHRFEDGNGDGDARDAGEVQLELFDLQEFGDTSFFPNAPAFGKMMADPYYGFSVAPRFVSPWTVLDAGLAGTGGLVPALAGDGGLQGDELQTLALTDALPSATAYFVLGASYLGAPFKQGILSPSTDVIVPLAVAPTGEIRFDFLWPTGVPAGVSLFYQYWIDDPAGPAGFSASNGLQSTTP